MNDFNIQELNVVVDIEDTYDDNACYHKYHYDLCRTDSPDKEVYEWYVPKHGDKLEVCKIDGYDGHPEVDIDKYKNGNKYWVIKIRQKHLQGKKVTLEFDSYQPSRPKELYRIPGLFEMYQYIFRVGNEVFMEKGSIEAIKPKNGRLFLHGINVFNSNNDHYKLILQKQDPHSPTSVSVIHLNTTIFSSAYWAWGTLILPVILSIIASSIFTYLSLNGGD